ncbi:hypothetical protein VNO77_34473 [Canavalia gladiata]|uniref:Uncharacterized protein n=1 Tax=Canavalia gladiata TaxID=3824 RepID=A0AAN9PYK0_CANGL
MTRACLPSEPMMKKRVQCGPLKDKAMIYRSEGGVTRFRAHQPSCIRPLACTSMIHVACIWVSINQLLVCKILEYLCPPTSDYPKKIIQRCGTHVDRSNAVAQELNFP